MIENILIIDLETTGLSPEKDKTIEIGAVLYNIREKVVLQQLGFFLPCEENPVEHINHIKPEWTRLTSAIGQFMDAVIEMMTASDALVAHNAKFDKGFLDKLFPVYNKWICTKDDFKWPVQLNRKRLQDVCEAMGVPYVDAHRSLPDCNLLVQCFNKVDDLYERFNGTQKAKAFDFGDIAQ